MGGRDQIMCALPSLSLLFGVGKTRVLVVGRVGFGTGWRCFTNTNKIALTLLR